MSSVISLRLSDSLLHALDHKASVLHLHRAEYIRKAIEQMNHIVFESEQKQRLTQASMRVRKESMRVNKDFDQIEDDPEN